MLKATLEGCVFKQRSAVGSAGNGGRGYWNKELLSGGPGGLGRLWARELLPPAAEAGVESLGHDARGARAAVSADVGGMIAGPALCVRHSLSPRGKSEGLTIPFPSLPPQGPGCQQFHAQRRFAKGPF